MLCSHHFQNIFERPREKTMSRWGQSKEMIIVIIMFPNVLMFYFGKLTAGVDEGKCKVGVGVGMLLCTSSFLSALPLKRMCMASYPNISGVDTTRTTQKQRK